MSSAMSSLISNRTKATLTPSITSSTRVKKVKDVLDVNYVISLRKFDYARKNLRKIVNNDKIT